MVLNQAVPGDMHTLKSSHSGDVKSNLSAQEGYGEVPPRVSPVYKYERGVETMLDSICFCKSRKLIDAGMSRGVVFYDHHHLLLSYLKNVTTGRVVSSHNNIKLSVL